MKYALIIALAIALTGCGALAPAPPTPGPTATARVIVQTVVVTVLVTLPPTTTPTPSLTPIPTFTTEPSATPAVSTPGGTAAAGTATVTGTIAAAAANITPTATLPADAGGGIFGDFSRSSDQFALNCQPDTITFGVTATDANITEVDFFYRMEDQKSGSISGWVDIAKMVRGNDGTFTYDFKSSLVAPDVRSHRAWFDYQFVALNKLGAVVGRSAKIVKQITYRIECTD